MALVDAGTIVIYGGFAGSTGTTAEILRFDPATGRSTRIGSLSVAVHDAAGVKLSGSALIFGGGRLVPESVVQRIDPSGASMVVGKLPKARADLGAVALDQSAFVLAGGISGALDRTVLATADGTTFRQVGLLTYGVRYAAVAAFGGHVYVIGGVGASGDRDEIQRIDPVTGIVEVIGRMPRSISHASALVIGERLLIVGGISRGVLQDTIWQVDGRSGAVELVGRLPNVISDFASAVVGNVGYVIGGETTRPVASIVSIATP